MTASVDVVRNDEDANQMASISIDDDDDNIEYWVYFVDKTEGMIEQTRTGLSIDE